MRKCVKIIYGISFTLVIFMLAFFHIHERTDQYIARNDTVCQILTDYEVTSYEDASAPMGITQEYKWTLTDIPTRSCCIMFYTVHQAIEIYVEDELLYSLSSNEDNFFTQGTGCDWAKAFLFDEDEGKEIRILVHPIYEASIDNDLTIYYGTYDTIYAKIITDNFFVLLIGIVAIIIGLVFLLFVLLNFKNHDLDKSIAMLGFFSIFAGLWKISDMSSSPLLFKSPLTLSALAIISLSMMVVPYVFFIRNQFARTRHLFWDLLCIGCSFESIFVVILQLTGIADLRETLFLCHIMTVLVIIAIFIMMIWEALHTKYSTKLKITVSCCVLCLLGTCLDMAIYYLSGSSGNMVYCLMAFLIYVVLMGYMSVKEATKLMERGKEAKRYELLAMHDELTGLYNRAFYAEYLKKHNMQCKDCFIIMLDVNNLKQCNDNIGHDCGDRLLKNSSYIIEQAFLPEGKCIRLGGDEFCVILRHINEEECQTYLSRFDERLAEFNISHPDEFPIHIAYGYAHFDENIDFDFGDTLRRADKGMYQMKMAMKTNDKNI